MATIEQTTFGALLDSFTGRKDDPEYEARKTMKYRIHRRNRAYVWKKDKRVLLLDSARRKFYIPAITVNECVVVDSDGVPRIVHQIMDGGNRITTARLIDTDRVGFPVTVEDKDCIRATPIIVVVLHNLTSAQQREMFRRLNNPTKVSAGQLYAMSEEDAPLVREAVALISDAHYPERDRLDKHFPTIARTDAVSGVRRDSEGRTTLANAVGLVAGLVYGVQNITTSFDRQEDVLLTDIDRSRYLPTLRMILDIFDEVDNALPDFDKRKRCQQWGLGFVLGAMLYDIKSATLSNKDIALKWKNYLVRVRAKTPNAEDAITGIGGANNLNPTRLLRISRRVDVFLAEDRLLSKEELKQINHVGESGDVVEDIDDEDSLLDNIEDDE